MDPEYITRQEHDELCKRLDGENKVQDHRLDVLENMANQINSLAVSVEKMAISIENMSSELSLQSKRLDSLESKDGEKYRETIKQVLTFLVGVAVAVVGAWIKNLLGW